ncbi:MAG: hypothetical protein WAT78_08140 [Rhizobiaceae bacterium]
MATGLEHDAFKWERFDGEDFSRQPGEHRGAIGLSREDFDAAGAEKAAEPDLDQVFE